MSAEFVHLHVHSHYSLLDAMNRLDELAARTRALGMRAIALTDHGNLFGAIEFHRAALSHGVKPIIGCELYVVPDNCETHGPRPDGFERGCHLTVLAATADGYRNLVRLASDAYTRGFYYHPRVDHDLLASHADGLIALSGCLSSETSKRFLSGDHEGAANTLRRYRDIFGAGNFYVELQDHGIVAQKELMAFLMARAKADHMPTVATNDVHYLHSDDAPVHDALLCIGTRSLLRDEKRKRYGSDQFYLKTPEEMRRRFAFDLDAIQRTVEIAERVELEITFGKHHLPSFPVPIGEGGETDHLRRLAEEGLKARAVDDDARYHDRLKIELDVIVRRGFAGYFLIVSDFISEARRRGIPVGPGRGSAAGSLVAYSLGITEVDPIRYGLIFERFLNPERTSLPDIDVDICQERREEVIDYVRQRYGEDRVAQIITFGTFGAKAVIRDVCRVHDVPIPDTERLARLVPDILKITLAEAIEKVEELKTEAEGPRAELFRTALRLEGLARHASRHAAGIVIANVPITEVAPLYRDSEGHVVTQYDMASVDALGLLKIDILGLKTLTVIQAAAAAAGVGPAEVGPRPYDDRDVYALLSSGRTLGVFQLDSAGIRELIARIKPSSFEDLAALIALYRPGPMNLAEEFANRKHGRMAVSYLHPALGPILSETYGIILYQEQVMEIAHKLGGFTLAEADDLRKAMGKKNPELMSEKRAKFLEGAKRNAIPEDAAVELFNQMERFAGYGFNKSHAIAYAVLAYRTAWLKVRHAVSFMATALSHELGNRDKIGLYVSECRRMGLEILPPHVNHSGSLFAAEPDRPKAIRCGLAAVKNAGVTAAQAIVAERENGAFTTLWNLLERIDPKDVNRRTIEALLLAGGLDGLGPNRRSMLQALPALWDRAIAEKKDAESDQISLFGSAPRGEPVIDTIEEFPDCDARVLDALGFYLGDHPLFRVFPAGRFLAGAHVEEGRNCWLVGMIRDLETPLDKRGRPMARIALETLEGRAELLVFSSVYEKRRSALRPDEAVVAWGRVEASGRMLVDEVIRAAESRWLARLDASGRNDIQLAAIDEMLKKAERGSCAIELIVERDGKKFRIVPPHKVAPDILSSIDRNDLADVSLTPIVCAVYSSVAAIPVLRGSA
jgi:DNA polymerase-3 subunit alpha